MYKRFYELREKPFEIVPNPDYLYLSSNHTNALTWLEYGLSEGTGFILLTGEIGIGKTTLVRHLLNQVETEMDVAVIFNTNVSSEQIISMILHEFDLDDTGSKAADLGRLYEHLIKRYAQKKPVLVIVDEAQNLSPDALEELRMLSNLQADDEFLLKIMLVGQPELRDKLARPELVQLSQRIGVKYHISCLSREETGRYVSSRLEKAGGDPSLFTEDAVDMIFNISKGIPRSINLICDGAMVYGYADEEKTIGSGIILQVIEDREGEMPAQEDTSGAVPDFSGPVPVCPAPNGNDPLFQRILALESETRQLKAEIKQQAVRLDRQRDLSNDRLVEELKGLLAEERSRNSALLTENTLLKTGYDKKRKAENVRFFKKK